MGSIQVDVKDVIALRDAIVASGKDIHRPMNLVNKMKRINRDQEVNRSLMTLLDVEGEQSDKEVRGQVIGEGLSMRLREVQV